MLRGVSLTREALCEFYVDLIFMFCYCSRFFSNVESQKRFLPCIYDFLVRRVAYILQRCKYDLQPLALWNLRLDWNPFLETYASWDLPSSGVWWLQSCMVVAKVQGSYLQLEMWIMSSSSTFWHFLPHLKRVYSQVEILNRSKQWKMLCNTCEMHPPLAIINHKRNFFSSARPGC